MTNTCKLLVLAAALGFGFSASAEECASAMVKVSSTASACALAPARIAQAEQAQTMRTAEGQMIQVVASENGTLISLPMLDDAARARPIVPAILRRAESMQMTLSW